MDLELLFFGIIRKVVLKAIASQVSFSTETFFNRRKIESRIDDAMAVVLEPIIPFLQAEKIPDEDIALLLEVCGREIDVVVDAPERLFSGSLDGQRIFDQLYADRKLPEELADLQLVHVYTRVFPQIANLVCAIPEAIKQWSIVGYREQFRRLDQIQTTLSEVVNKFDTSHREIFSHAARVLDMIRQNLLQRVDFQLDLTGLRGDRPDAVPLEKLFVPPSITRSTDQVAGMTAEALVTVMSSLHAPARLTGGPGSGKSTLCLWIQRTLLAKPGLPVPILVRLRDLSGRDVLPSAQDLFIENAGPHLKAAIGPDLIRRWLDYNEVMVILDGFDEVHPGKRDTVDAWISELGTFCSPAGILISSRPLTTDHLKFVSKQFHIAPFDEPNVVDYAKRWYQFAPLLHESSRKADVETLVRGWYKDPLLQHLVRVPLTLATVLMVHHIDGELPSGRSKLYQRYIDGMLGLWDDRRFVLPGISLNGEEKTALLIDISIFMHARNVDQLADDDIRDVVTECLSRLRRSENGDKVLQHLLERSGLLVGPGQWSFIHKSVGEFLVALAIRQGNVSAGEGRPFDRLTMYANRHNDRWNSVLFFWAGLASPIELQEFLANLIQKGEAESDYSLAGGLMLDQAAPYRLSIEWRRTWTIELMKQACAQWDSDAARYSTTSPSSLAAKVRDEFLTLYQYSSPLLLRSMANVEDRTAFRILLRAASVQWQEVRSLVSPAASRSLRILFLRMPDSLAQLQEVAYELRAESSDATDLATLLVHAGRGCYLMVNSPVKPAEYRAVVEQTFPEHVGILSIVSVATFVSEDVLLLPLAVREAVQHQLAVAINAASLCTLDRALLEMTTHWTSGVDRDDDRGPQARTVLRPMARFASAVDMGTDGYHPKKAPSHEQYSPARKEPLSAFISFCNAIPPTSQLYDLRLALAAEGERMMAAREELQSGGPD